MSCRLCLSSAGKLINIFNKQGEDKKGIVSLINKFITIEFKSNMKTKEKICASCWSNVNNFQRFCAMIDEKQKELQLLKSTVEKRNFHEQAVNNEMQPELGTINKKQKGLQDLNKAIKETHFQAQEMNIEIKFEDDMASSDELESEQNEQAANAYIESFNLTNDDNINIPVHNKDETVVSENVPKSTNGALPRLLKVEREASARKIGRPRKKDAAISLEEDDLIANHMQLNCEICKLNMQTFYKLKEHFKIVHNMNGYVVCCNKRLYKRGILIDHINVHKNPEYFKCVHCAKLFADRVCMRNHIMLKHKTAEELCYQCEHCGKKFAKLCFLQEHALKHTTNEQRNFMCDLCKKGYPSASRLKVHQKNVHGDGSLKVCSHCGLLLRGKNNFERHLMQHDKALAKTRRMQCSICDNWLADKYCLRLHMQRHEDDQTTYNCDICGKDAPTRVALNAHYRYNHSNAEPKHKCQLCQKAFKTPRALREHMTTHTGETLYTCSYCDKKFKCSSNLHSHRKWQHPNEWARDKNSSQV